MTYNKETKRERFLYWFKILQSNKDHTLKELRQLAIFIVKLEEKCDTYSQEITVYRQIKQEVKDFGFESVFDLIDAYTSLTQKKDSSDGSDD